MTATQVTSDTQRRRSSTGHAPPRLTFRWQMIAQVVCVLYIAAHYIALLFQTSYKSTLLDEISALVLLPLAGLFALSKPGRLPAALFLGYLALLVIGGYLSPYGGVPQPRAALVAAALDAKIAIFAFALAFMVGRSPEPEKILRATVYTLAAFALLNLPFFLLDLARGSDIYGAPLTIKGGFPQPRALLHHHTEAAWLYCLAGLGTFALYQERRRLMFLWLSLAFGAALLISLSIKEIAAFLIGLIVIAGSTQGGRFGKIIFAACIIGGGMVVLYSTNMGDAILGHAGMFVGESAIPTVRGAMTAASGPIALEHFPLGSGGGTFGSAPSYQFGYSETYYAYQINTLYGGSPEYSNFLQDVFWPKILAESGAIGLILYSSFFLIFLRRISSPKFKSSHLTTINKRLCLSFIITVMLISTASSPLTNELLLFICAISLAYSARHFKRSASSNRSQTA